jgi:LCP family protein required for cell wall assembly
MKKTSQKKRNSRMQFFRYLAISLVIVSIICLGLIYFINVLPLEYFGVCVVLFVIIDAIMIRLLLGKGWKKRMFGTLLSILLLIGIILGIVYELNTIGFMNNFGSKNYKTQNYSVVVLNSSKYNKIKDIKNEDVGILSVEDTEGLADAVAHLNKKVSVTYKEKDDVGDLETSLLNGDLSVILLEDTYLEIAKEENEEFSNNTKVIYQFPIDIATEDVAKNVDITEKSFNIFIAGIDTYGKISSVSRSDVNMVVTVNPKTHKILLTSIPRDYYVYLHGITSYKDKLTHAGIHGIDMSVKTVEDLLDCDINYYFKVNFTSLIDIVDAIGGIEVNSSYTFSTYDNKYTFNKGVNKLDGEKALYFVRERKAFSGGDRTRNQNQQLVLTAIINKVMSKTLITKYNSILKSVDGSFVTNLDDDSITKFIKKQIKTNDSWTIESINLNGTDSYNYTYSYKTAKSYVMEPDIDSVNEAIAKINEVMNEKEE